MAPATVSNQNGTSTDDRWEGVVRPYTQEEVEKVKGSIKIEYTLADRGAKKLWSLMKSEPYVHSLGAMTGNQVIFLFGSHSVHNFFLPWSHAPTSLAIFVYMLWLCACLADIEIESTWLGPSCVLWINRLQGDTSHCVQTSWHSWMFLQAMQSVRAGLKAIYCSGWQVAADSNVAGQVKTTLTIIIRNS